MIALYLVLFLPGLVESAYFDYTHDNINGGGRFIHLDLSPGAKIFGELASLARDIRNHFPAYNRYIPATMLHPQNNGWQLTVTGSQRGWNAGWNPILKAQIERFIGNRLATGRYSDLAAENPQISAIPNASPHGGLAGGDVEQGLLASLPA